MNLLKLILYFSCYQVEYDWHAWFTLITKEIVCIYKTMFALNNEYELM